MSVKDHDAKGENLEARTKRDFFNHFSSSVYQKEK